MRSLCGHTKSWRNCHTPQMLVTSASKATVEAIALWFPKPKVVRSIRIGGATPRTLPEPIWEFLPNTNPSPECGIFAPVVRSLRGHSATTMLPRCVAAGARDALRLLIDLAHRSSSYRLALDQCLRPSWGPPAPWRWGGGYDTPKASEVGGNRARSFGWTIRQKGKMGKGEIGITRSTRRRPRRRRPSRGT